MSLWNSFADTLLQLSECVDASAAPGFTVSEADIECPLEIRIVGDIRGGHGIVLQAIAPHSRWNAGFLPPVHRCRLRLTATED
jgi:hypothetical protein